MNSAKKVEKYIWLKFDQNPDLERQMIKSIQQTELPSYAQGRDDYINIGNANSIFKKAKRENRALSEMLIKEAVGQLFWKDFVEYSEGERFTFVGSDKERKIFYVDPLDIKPEMYELINRLSSISPERFLLEFLTIHPFGDGNGRISKLIYHHLKGEYFQWRRQEDFEKILRKYAKYRNYWKKFSNRLILEDINKATFYEGRMYKYEARLKEFTNSLKHFQSPFYNISCSTIL